MSDSSISSAVRTADAALAALGALVLGLAVLAGARPAEARPLAGFYSSLDHALKLERRGLSAEARDDWARVLACGEELIRGDDPLAVYVMGTARAAYGVGDPARAAALYDDLLTRAVNRGEKPDQAYPWALIWLGLARARLGQPDAAVAAWEQVPPGIGEVYGAVRERLAAGSPDAASADALEAAIRRAMLRAGWGDRATLRQMGGAQPGVSGLDAPEVQDMMSIRPRSLMDPSGRWGSSLSF